MAGTSVGWLKAKAKMIKSYGSEENFLQMVRERGAKGGKASNTGGFAANRTLAVSAGRKGGKTSRKRKGTMYYGLEYYLEYTNHKHDGYGYWDFVKMLNDGVRQKDMEAYFLVSRTTVEKWVRQYKKEFNGMVYSKYENS